VTPDAAGKLQSDLESAGKRAHFSIYPGVDHGFFNETRPDVYDASAATRAWSELLAFLRAELG
jgi:carboxymethylenebutenolidase